VPDRENQECGRLVQCRQCVMVALGSTFITYQSFGGGVSVISIKYVFIVIRVLYNIIPYGQQSRWKCGDVHISWNDTNT
jgi:hypothetical protein